MCLIMYARKSEVGERSLRKRGLPRKRYLVIRNAARKSKLVKMNTEEE